MEAEEIRALRVWMGWSQERLADLLRVSFATVNRWEDPGYAPRPKGLPLDVLQALRRAKENGTQARTLAAQFLGPRGAFLGVLFAAAAAPGPSPPAWRGRTPVADSNPPPDATQRADPRAIRVDDGRLRVRTANALSNAGVWTYAELLPLRPAELLMFHGMRRQCVDDIVAELAVFGLELDSCPDCDGRPLCQECRRRMEAARTRTRR